MNKRPISYFLLIAASLLVWPPLSSAEFQLPPECQEGQLGVNDPKTPGPDFQLTLICVPSNWNGTLVLYAHGFVPPQFPLVLPIQELTIQNTFVPQLFLGQGFAFATSSYHKNGAATEQAIGDLLDLLNAFESSALGAALRNVFIIGASEGGLTAIQLIEQHPDRFNAGLALCAPAGGALKQLKYVNDFRVVFDYFFPRIFPFGAFNVPATAFMQWDQYASEITTEMTRNLRATTELFSVTRAAADPTNSKTFISTATQTALDVLFYSIWETPDLIATAGGIPYDNRFTLYLGLTNNLALNLRVERIKGDRGAENYARMFYQTTGNLKRPLVTLHNILDPITPFDHELIYQGLVTLEHKNRFLTVLPVPGYGHCDFTTDQILGAFALMLQQGTATLP